MLRFALGSVFLLASIHSSLCATISVTVGGPGVLRFNPPSVVRTSFGFILDASNL